MNTLSTVRFRDAVASDLTALVRLDAICFSPEMRYSADVMRFFAFHRNSRAIVESVRGSVQPQWAPSIRP